MEQRSGSSTPQRSCSAAGLHRPRLSIDAAAAAECQSLMGSLSGSFVGSISSVPPRLGSHTMDFFEMCASLIMALARWAGHRTPSTWRCTVRTSSNMAVLLFFCFLPSPHHSTACGTEPVPLLRDPKCTQRTQPLKQGIEEIRNDFISLVRPEWNIYELFFILNPMGYVGRAVK